jgi:uncharacterized protein YfiM (DUF2279 family)
MKPCLTIAFSLQLVAASDAWLSRDKVQHFFLGAFVQGVAFSVADAAGAPRPIALSAASAVSVSAVLAKEIRDRNGRGTPSVKDAVWGLAGAAAISPLLARTK